MHGHQQGFHTLVGTSSQLPLTSTQPPKNPSAKPGKLMEEQAVLASGRPERHRQPLGAPYLHVVVLDAVVRQGLQECLGVVAQGARVGTEAGLAGRGAPGGAAVVLVLLLVVAVVGLAGLQASREDGRLQPL